MVVVAGMVKPVLLVGVVHSPLAWTCALGFSLGMMEQVKAEVVLVMW